MSNQPRQTIRILLKAMMAIVSVRAVNGRLKPRVLPSVFVWVAILACFLIVLPGTTMAAVTFTALVNGSGGNTNNQSSWTTGTLTPSANYLILVWVTNTKDTSPPDIPTLSGNGLTWVQVSTVTWGTIGTPLYRTTLFRAMGASPFAGTNTISFGGVAQSGCIYRFVQFGNVNTSGTNGSGAVVQSQTGRSDSATYLSITLAPLADASNGTAGGFANNINNASSITAGSGYTIITGRTYTTPNTSQRMEYNLTGNATVDVNTTSGMIAGIAVEIGALLAPIATAATNIQATSFSANWNATSSATGYYLDVATDSGFTSFVTGYQDLNVGNVLTYSVNSNISSGTTYYYRLRAVNGSGTSGSSNTITLTTLPDAPVADAATNIQSTSFSANWYASTGATGYYLDVATDIGFTSFVTGYNNLDVGNVTTYSVNSNINPNTTYYYRVRAYNGSGTSGNSNTITLTTGPSPPVATAATNIQATSFSANWNPSLGATGYYLDVATDIGFTTFISWEYENRDVGAVFTYPVSHWSISPGTTYYYRVRAYNGNGTSGNSNTISVTTLDAVTLGNHTLWQVTNRFTTTSPVTDVFFRFNLRRSAATAVTAVRVNFTVGSGVANGDVTGGALYRDNNSDGEVDAGDTTLRTGVAGSGGQLAFTGLSEDPGASGTHYLVRATVANLVVGDSTIFSLGPTGVDSSLEEIGSISDATHTRISVPSLYRSVGTNANDLNTGGRTVTISGTTATFSDSMPTNIGVGDVLQYNSGGLRVAVIHGRTSSTVFTVQNKNGGTPTAAPALTAVGVYRAYTSLANWQSQTQNSNITADNINPNKDLLSANTTMNVACYGDGEDTTQVIIDGWTTGVNNYIKIYTPVSSSEVGIPQRHNGKWDDTKYRLSAAPAENEGVVEIRDDFIRIEGLQILVQTTTNSNVEGINGNCGYINTVSDVRISHNIVRAGGSLGVYAGGIYIWKPSTSGGSSPTVRIWNNIVYDFASSYGAGIGVGYNSSPTGYVYNNTVYGCVDGYIADDHGTIIAKNNIGYNNTNANYRTGGDGTFSAASTNNLSGPQKTDAPGSNPRNGPNMFVTFVDPNGSPRDLHLASSDAGAKDRGTSLSSDTNLAFSDDIDRHSRPFGSAWDIGADEYMTGLFAYRRQITFPNAMTPASCSSDLSNFPVLVKVTDPNLRSVSNGGHVESPNGYDIVFRAVDGTTHLDHEIEEYHGGSISKTWQITANTRDAWDDGASQASLDHADFSDAYYGDAGGYQFAATIPQGATITSARLRLYFTGRSGTSAAYTAKIRIEDIDSASAFTGAVGNIRSRSYWGTTVDWSMPAAGLPVGWNSSPDVTNLIQHIVNRAGWSSGNYLNIAIWSPDDTGGTKELIHDYNDGSSVAAQLEVTYQDPSAGQLIAWVRIPTLAYNADTTIYMYYGNAGIIASTANPAGVWDTSYKGVWHLKESGNGTAGEYDDSTQYANEGQGGRGNPLYVPAQTAGQIGYGQGFDNADGKWDLVDVGNGSSLNITGNQITLEAWVRHNVTPPGHLDYGILNRKGWSSGYRLLMRADTYGCAQPLCLHFNLGEGGTFLGTATLLTAGSWHHVVGTYDGSLVKVFIDGVQDANTWSKTAALTAPPPPEDHVWIGHGDQPTDVTWSSEWQGEIDEVRISSVARSTCWVQTQYTNQSSATNVNLGGEQVVDSTYSYHQPITIANAMTPASCTTNLSNFPVLIDTTNWATADKNPLRTVANSGHVQSTNGYDIIFRDTNDLHLDHEIEKYDGSTGTLVAWVRIPTLVYNADTRIYIHYGNAAITSPTANPTGVWDASYKGVWHFSETSGTHYDSTGNNNDSTSVTVTTQGSAVGKADGADFFDGSVTNDYISVANTGSSLNVGQVYTLEAWIKRDGTGVDGLLTKAYSDQYSFKLAIDGSDRLELYVNTGSGYNSVAGGALNDTAWHHVGGYSDGTNLKVFIDEAVLGSTGSTPASIPYDSSGLFVGAGRWGSNPTDYFDGIIDEVRVSNVVRDACWLGTQYNNQSSPSTTVTTGGEQVEPSTYDYHQAITIANGMTPGSCTGNLSNFPVLIDTTNWSATYKDPLKTAPTGHVQSTNGYDIIFRDTSDLQLDHEIEKYDGATGTLIAWVRVPTLAYNADTTIYMYYGNSAITAPTARPTGVWNTSYGWRGVWHLADTSGDTRDSTSYDTNGVVSGITRGATGQIDGAFNSDTNDYVNMGDPADGHLDFGADSFTVSAWLNIDAPVGAGAWPQVIWKGNASWGTGYVLEYDDDTNNFYFVIEDGNPQYGCPSPAASFSEDTWTYIVGVVDRTNTRIRIYKNGVEQGAGGDISLCAGSVSNADNFTIGIVGGTGNPDGLIDEVRVSSVARDACWVGTEYNNQSAPDTYVTPAGEQTEPAVYTSQRTITIRDAMTPSPACTSNLTNFPILIDTTNWAAADKDSLKMVANGGNVENSNGYDIIFRDTSDLKLDHEIEKYDGATGTLVAWVKIPTLAYNANTTITMYYGNSGITGPTQNAPGVWSNGFREVWHLRETGGGTVADSTGSAYTGTASAGVNQNPATEKIDGADGLNGSTGVLTLNDGTLTVNSSFTFEGWFYLGASLANGAYAGIVTKHREEPATEDWVGLYAIHDDGGGCPDSCLLFGWGYLAGRGGNLHGTTPTPLATGQWYYAAGTFDQGASGARRLYVNGSIEAEDSGGHYDVNLTRASRVGNDGLDPAWLNGFVDEIRISSVPRDACWIGTSYNTVQYAGDTNYITPGSELGFGPTEVKLTSFKATRYPEGTLIEWKTGHEVDNLGFHVYREEKGQLTRLTPEPVAGSAFLAGSRLTLRAGRHYSWWDFPTLATGPSSLATQIYWLKDIDLNGTHTMHGPVSPVLSKEPLPNKFRPELLSELGMKLEERYRHYWKVQELRERLKTKNVNRYTLLGKTNNDKTNNNSRITNNKMAGTLLKGRRPGPRGNPVPDPQTQWFLASRPAVKLFVKEEGWYRVSQAELVAAGLSPRVDPRYLQLFVEGREQPIGVIGGKDGRFGPRDAIEFYGVGLDTPSTDTRVYWLVEGSKPGKRVELSRSQGSRIVSSSFPYTVEKKDRWIYLPAIKNGEEENFFGSVVYGSRVDQVLEVKHIDLATSEDAVLEVALQGATTGSHRVKVYLNDEEVGEVVFEGQSRGLVSLPVSPSELEEGENLVSFIPQGGEMDISLVDTIRLTYWHTYRADDNGLRFTARGGNGVSIDGYSDSSIRVFDITDSNEVIEVIGRVESQKESYAVGFRVPGHGERTLLALSGDRVKNPVEIVSDHPSSWHQERGGYGLLIISHREFFHSLQHLIKLRESQGYKVALIDIEDIYDEFSFGNKSPHALRDFLSLAKKQWSKPPRFVLLVGDASFDPRNYLGSGGVDFVPTKLIDTQHLETASDDWFVDLNGDGLPEMAIGRLPVQTKEEAATVVSKIVGYEKSGKKSEALLVADRVDKQDEFSFEGASEEIRAQLPSSLMVRKIYRGQFSSDEQARGVLLSAINQAPLLVNFIGHGSIEIWRGIFTSEDAETLINKGLPFFVSMTCLNGYFQDPYSETLAESLLKVQGGGAVAIWTSSGLTEPDQQAVMNKELIKLLFGRESLTLGEATVRAKASVSDQDIRKTWILFGDPTTRLRP